MQNNGVPFGPGHSRAEPEEVSVVPTSVPNAAPNLPQLLDLAAASDHRNTADQLESLRERLGRDSLSVDEWNALIGAASYLRIEAWRRERRASGTLTEGGDVKQAPGDSLSGPTLEEGDADE